MKKRIVLIVSVLLIVCLFTGIVYAKIINHEDAFANLSEEDKVLKTKISEISDTKIDFRHRKQETFENKTYDISFKEFNSENSSERKVIYTNDFGDEFKYDIKTGKLCEARIISKVVEKNDNSIDIETAHKIAVEYFSKNGDFSQYTQIASKEMEKGYFFWYKRYLGKYETIDGFSMTVGYDGSIVTYHDATLNINWEKLKIDEDYITSKIDAFVKTNNAVNVNYDTATVALYQGKICVDVTYDIVNEDGTNGSYATSILLED